MQCTACGANALKKRNGYYECEFCGSKYEIDQSNRVASKEVTDAKIIALYHKAAEFMLKNEYAQELKTLTEALELDEENDCTLVKMGRCYRMLGFNDKALEMYNKAISINPQNGTAYTNTGTILILQQRWREAAAKYERGLPYIDQSADDYWTAYANYAVAIAKLGNPIRAEQMIKQAEQHGYKNGDGCRNLAGIKAQPKPQQPQQKSGCYVATCVYHSYDCPEVWTLRRFRDNALRTNVPGRAFVRLYYAVSPALVRRFGDKAWFRKSCKSLLDPMVRSLRSKGYASTPYTDQ